MKILLPFRLIALILLLACSIENSVLAADAKMIIKKIPVDDQKILQSLFYDLAQSDNFNYTLFGNKPLSLSGDYTLTPTGNTLLGMVSGGVFWDNWAVWKKYELWFSITQYILIVEPSINCENVNNVIFINKKAFIEKVNDYLPIFRKILNENITGEDLLRKIDENKKFVKFIKNNELLWGLLLGYGLHNAQLFQRRAEIEQFLDGNSLPKLPIKSPEPSPLFSSLEDECAFINSQLRSFESHSYSPLLQNALHFAADLNNPETLLLKKKYQKLRYKLSNLLSQGDFLEIILTQLTSTDPIPFYNIE